MCYDQKRALLSSGTVFPFGVPLDVADAFFAVLLEPGEHILKGHLRGFLPLFRFPDVGLAAAGRTGLLSVGCIAVSTGRSAAALSVVSATALSVLFCALFCLFHGK